MHLRAALFDLDDTLHDKSATLRVVAARQYAEANLAALGVSDSRWERAFVELNNLRIDKTEVFFRLSQQFGLTTSLQEVLLGDFDANLGSAAVPFPGAAELLRMCKSQGIKVGIVTNGRDAFQRSKISGMGLLPFVDAVVTSGAFGVKKPDPSIFLACLNLLDVQAEHEVFVGDDLSADVEPSLKLGMRAILKSEATLPGAWRCAEDLYGVSALIQADA